MYKRQRGCAYVFRLTVTVSITLPSAPMSLPQAIQNRTACWRELEGALIRLAAYASLSKRRIDLEFAQETLGSAITPPP